MNIRETKDRSEFDEVIENHQNGQILQSYGWGQRKSNSWQPIGGMLLLKRRVPFINKTILYCPRGPVIDFNNADLFVYTMRELRKIAKYHDFNKMISAINMNIRELKDLADSRKKFIDNLTHEMKTPLTSIIGFADILRSARSVDEDARVEYANAIYDEAIHFKNLSDRLMEMILLERSQPDLERVKMDEFLHEISSQIVPLLERRNIQLNVASESCIMLIDKELIKSMVVNLIDNASKSYTNGGVIELTLKRSGNGKTALSVRDYGCGIPEDELNKVIEPFYVLDKARTRKSGGTGLGLALCREIASVHKARLTIDSRLGQGTCVTVAFEEDGL